MRSMLAAACVLAALAAGCGGGGGGGTTPGGGNSSFPLTSASLLDGASQSFQNSSLPAGTGAAPTPVKTSLAGTAGGSVALGLNAPAGITDILIGVQGQTGYFDVPVAGSRGRQGSGNSLYNLAIGISPGASSLTLQIETKSGGSVSAPATVNLAIGGSNFAIPRSTTARWTVLVYINAANNLEPFSLENIDQMEQAPYSSDVNVVVEWKRWHGESSVQEDTGFDASAPEFDGTRRYWLTGRGHGGWQNDQVQDLGSGAVGAVPESATVDLGAHQALTDFLQWGRTNFPAQHTLVVIWNHGAGWEHRAVGRRPLPHRGVSYDDQSGSSIETWQLAQAFPNPVDLIAIDCSLMQMVEVDYQLRNEAPYIVGSEDSPPGDGYPYQLWLPLLTSNPSMDPLTVGKSIADTDFQFYQNHADSGGTLDSITQSVVSTGALPAVATAISQLANTLETNRTQFASSFARARDTANEYAIEGMTPTNPGKTIYPEYKDLVQYCTLLKQFAPTAPGVSQAADQVIQAVGQAVVDNQTTRSDSFSHGLSIYVPVAVGEAAPPQSFDNTYANLDFDHDTNWARWLQDQVQ